MNAGFQYCGASLAVWSLPFVAIAMALLAAGCTAAPRAMLLRGGTVYDGSGAPGVRADVLIIDDRIKAVGLDLDAGKAPVKDVTGLAVCPGFIDVHTHTV